MDARGTPRFDDTAGLVPVLFGVFVDFRGRPWPTHVGPSHPLDDNDGFQLRIKRILRFGAPPYPLMLLPLMWSKPVRYCIGGFYRS